VYFVFAQCVSVATYYVC